MSGHEGPTTPFADYRRNARRLRARHGHDLATLHAGLMKLSGGSDRSSSEGVVRRGQTGAAHVTRFRSTAAPESTHPLLRDLPLDDRSRAFAQTVLRSLTTDLLTYSSRSTLVRLAEASGIRRFDANLIIALVQQRMGLVPTTSMAQASIDLTSDAEATALSPKALFFAAVIVQTLIVLAVWAVVHLD